MDQVYDDLTTRVKSVQLRARPDGDSKPPRVLIALAGPPGSGKSTIATEVVRRLNQSPTHGRAITLPMDGFHLTRASLHALPNKEEAFARRGVYWTYDAEGVIQLVRSLRQTCANRSVLHLAPCFDHVAKDPIVDAIEITPDVGLIVIEGNWLLFDEEPWSVVSTLVDDTWFVDVDRDLALARVAKRHVECGIEPSWEAAVRRATNNDMVNGDLVRDKLIEPAVRVQSVDCSKGPKMGLVDAVALPLMYRAPTQLSD